MSKPLIKSFVLKLESKIELSLFARNSDSHDEIASKLLINYFDHVQSIDDIYPSFLKLLSQLQVLPGNPETHLN